MNGKFAILLLLAAAAQNSLAQNTSKSCVDSTSSIKSGLAIINYGEEASINGLRKMADSIYNEVVSILGEKSSKKHVRSGNNDARFQLAKDAAHEGLLSGIEPTAKAIKVFQTGLDMPAILNRTTLVVQVVIDDFFSAINVTRTVTNYTAAEAELAEYSASLKAIGSVLIEALYGALINGKTPIPEASIPTIACIGQKAKSYISAAIEGITKEIAILLDAVHGIGTKDANKRITAAWKEGKSNFDTEVRYKYSMMRNLVVGAYLKNSTDIVTGLFDIQSTVPGYTDI